MNMSCNIDGELLRAVALGLCEDREADEIAVHVRSCAKCREELAGHQRAATMLVTAFDDDPPDWLAQKTIARIRERRSRSFTFIGWGVPAAAGIVVMLLLMLPHPQGWHLNYRHPAATLTKNENAGSARHLTNDQKNGRMSLLDALTDEMGIDGNDPIDDRSIYETLDIAPEVASLLL
jgi:hypothetical protein